MLDDTAQENLAAMTGTKSDVPPVATGDPPKDETPTTPPVDPFKTTEPKKEGERPTPEPGSPRWEQIYGRMKQGERDVETLTGTVAELKENSRLMQEHNTYMADAMEKMLDRTAKTDRPNPEEDPEGFARWATDEATRKLKAEQRRESPPAPVVENADVELKKQVDTARDMWDDYDAQIGNINAVMEKDPALKAKVWNSKNPPAAAYTEALKLKVNAGRVDQGFVEGGGPGGEPSEDKVVLSAEQKKLCRAFGITEEKYIAQQEQITRMKGGK